MIIQGIKTEIIQPYTSIPKLLSDYLPTLEEKSILVLSSKIVSLAQGNIVKKSAIKKEQLIFQESDQVLGQGGGVFLTLKRGIFIPNAGIDESNGQDFYILWPKDLYAFCHQTWNFLKQHFHLEKVGVMVIDSIIQPLRKGTTAISLGHFGFDSIKNYIGDLDLYQQPLQITTMNITDSLACAANIVLGEGNEQTPLAIIEQVPHLIFHTTPTSLDQFTQNQMNHHSNIIQEDLFYPLLKSIKKDS